MNFIKAIGTVLMTRSIYNVCGGLAAMLFPHFALNLGVGQLIYFAIATFACLTAVDVMTLMRKNRKAVA